MIKKLFSKPSVTDTATAELYDAEQKLLQAQSALEYAQAMVEYNKNRVARLKQLISAEKPKQIIYPAKTEPVTTK